MFVRLAVFTFSVVLCGSFSGWAAVHTEPVPYQHGDALLEGYLAYDDSLTGKRPGVLVVHEWKGLNDYAKRRVEMLAGLGYIAFAADMYGKGVRAETHDQAAELSGVYRKDRALMRTRADAALQFLKSHTLTDPSKAVAIGYCFGGTTVLELARGGYDIKGVVSFHGGLDTPAPASLGDIKAKILVLHGAHDSFVPPDQVEAFKEEMKRAGADMRFVSLEGAVHSFTVPEAGDDPSKGMAYSEAADKHSWELMTNFLAEIFG